jgi:hypothetical protein
MASEQGRMSCAGGHARARDAARRDRGSSPTTGELRCISCVRQREGAGVRRRRPASGGASCAGGSAHVEPCEASSRQARASRLAMLAFSLGWAVSHRPNTYQVTYSIFLKSNKNRILAGYVSKPYRRRIVSDTRYGTLTYPCYIAEKDERGQSDGP